MSWRGASKESLLVTNFHGSENWTLAEGEDAFNKHRLYLASEWQPSWRESLSWRILLSFTAKFINEAKRSTTQATSEVLEGQHILQRGPATKDNKIPKGENGPIREVGETSQHCAETKTKTPAREQHLCDHQLFCLSESLEPCFLFYKKGSQQRLSHRTDKWSKNEPGQWGPIAEFLASRTPYFSW